MTSTWKGNKVDNVTSVWTHKNLSPSRKLQQTRCLQTCTSNKSQSFLAPTSVRQTDKKGTRELQCLGEKCVVNYAIRSQFNHLHHHKISAWGLSAPRNFCLQARRLSQSLQSAALDCCRISRAWSHCCANLWRWNRRSMTRLCSFLPFHDLLSATVWCSLKEILVEFDLDLKCKAVSMRFHE